MSKLGIDVSDNNGVLDWDALRSQIDFAIIRLGYGSDIEYQDDRQAIRNMEECERLGIPYGTYIYSYALSEDEVISEFEHCVRMLGGRNPQLGVWFDMEDDDDYKDEHGMNVYENADTMNYFCNKFCELASNAGYKTGTYTNEDYCRNVVTDLHYPLWLAIWGPSEPSRDCVIWQYTNDGHFDGHSCRFDLNYYYGEFESNKEPEVVVDETPSHTEVDIDELANAVIRGDYGNGEERKEKLGNLYDIVQDRVNTIMGETTSTKYTTPVEDNSAPTELYVGQDVKFTGSYDYDGIALEYTDRPYKIAEIEGDRVVLTIYDEVYAAVNINEVVPQ